MFRQTPGKTSQNWQPGHPEIWSWMLLTWCVNYCQAGDLEVTGDFIMCFENRISAWARGSDGHKNPLLNSEVFINSNCPSGCPLGGSADEMSRVRFPEKGDSHRERAKCASWQCRSAEAPSGQLFCCRCQSWGRNNPQTLKTRQSPEKTGVLRGCDWTVSGAQIQ